MHVPFSRARWLTAAARLCDDVAQLTHNEEEEIAHSRRISEMGVRDIARAAKRSAVMAHNRVRMGEKRIGRMRSAPRRWLREILEKDQKSRC